MCDRVESRLVQDDLSPSADRAAGLSVLVIEDEVLIAMLLEDMLEEAGCTLVGPFASVSQAMAALPDAAFDVALVDMTLSDGTSAPVIDHLSARAVPFAVMSGQAPDAPDSRAAASLPKPFTFDQVVRALCELDPRTASSNS